VAKNAMDMIHVLAYRPWEAFGVAPGHGDTCMTRVVTLRDIAEKCGLSRSTVGHALRGNPVGLSEATVARVGAIARRMGYRPGHNETARRLALRRTGERPQTHVIGVIYPTEFFDLTIFQEVLRGLGEELDQAGYVMCLGHFPHDAATVRNAPFCRLISRGDLDGAMLVNITYAFEPLMKLLRSDPGFGDQPVVSVILDSPGLPSAVADMEEGGYRSAMHLIEKGHRHIMHVVLAEEYRSLRRVAGPKERLKGVRRAFRESGLDPSQHLHLFPFEPMWMNPRTSIHGLAELDAAVDGDVDAVSYLLDYLERHEQVTAILALNDAYALHLWYALHKAGYRIPADMSLVGFDDTDPMRTAQGENLLTTVCVPWHDIGRQGAAFMLDLLAGRKRRARRRVLPTELVVRGSTAPPPARRR
jgi:LacI family transcriptional regulator